MPCSPVTRLFFLWLPSWVVRRIGSSELCLGCCRHWFALPGRYLLISRSRLHSASSTPRNTFQTLNNSVYLIPTLLQSPDRTLDNHIWHVCVLLAGSLSQRFTTLAGTDNSYRQDLAKSRPIA